MGEGRSQNVAGSIDVAGSEKAQSSRRVLFEQGHVELIRGDRENVPPVAMNQPFGPQSAPQEGNVALQSRLRGRRGQAVPQVLPEPVRRHRQVGREKQSDQKPAAQHPTNRDVTFFANDHRRAQQSEPQADHQRASSEDDS